MSSVLRVKVCGVTTPDDARMCVDAGVDWLGINFVPSSLRVVGRRAASEIMAAVRAPVTWVAVVADQGVDFARARLDEDGFDWVQLHGSEPPNELDALQPRAYRAVGIATSTDVNTARATAGEVLLVDAKTADGRTGGTGTSFDWTLVRALSGSRRVLLAGGLTPENVARAVAEARPWGVDVASGVESEPRRKDPARVSAFVAAARGVRT